MARYWLDVPPAPDVAPELEPAPPPSVAPGLVADEYGVAGRAPGSGLNVDDIDVPKDGVPPPVPLAVVLPVLPVAVSPACVDDVVPLVAPLPYVGLPAAVFGGYDDHPQLFAV